MTQANETEKQPTMLEQMGGVTGLALSSLPVVVFVLVNAFAGLMPAIWSALGAAVLIGIALALRKGSVQPAVSAVFGVGIAAFIAYRTGDAKGFFLFGIWQSLVYGGAFILSILVRWPLAGVVWSFLNGQGTAWRQDKASVRDYDIATLVWALVFCSRFVVQRWLYDEASVGWLAAARLAMGYPLMAVALFATVWAVRRSDKRLKAALAAEEEENREAEERLRAQAAGNQVTDHQVAGDADAGDRAEPNIYDRMLDAPADQRPTGEQRPQPARADER
ncbi:DUF3159 domain-containing protein [Saccharothrix yanglingensis]|uniref:DUF3159 domain-containing protein n=1 Tax=Saccharothrix yanglingensis TaxID=659496 RepID=A0ABU0X2W9_9PSEU|nr:DUF3159 domain-containing protein [Saccharothrix yanglingensis]MDQ2585629.1 hypothetical protein [Saccharothrix yanglingensis]